MNARELACAAASRAASPGRGRRRAAGRRAVRPRSLPNPARRRRCPSPGRCNRRRRPAASRARLPARVRRWNPSRAARRFERLGIAGTRAGGQDAMVERDPLAVVGRLVAPFELQRLRIDEDAAGIDRRGPCAAWRVAPVRRRAWPMTSSLRARIRSSCNFGLGNSTPHCGHFAGFADHLGHVQQGLGGDAAAQQAGAAQPRVGLDDRRLPGPGRRPGRRRRIRPARRLKPQLASASPFKRPSSGNEFARARTAQSAGGIANW